MSRIYTGSLISKLNLQLWITFKLISEFSVSSRDEIADQEWTLCNTGSLRQQPNDDPTCQLCDLVSPHLQPWQHNRCSCHQAKRTEAKKQVIV